MSSGDELKASIFSVSPGGRIVMFSGDASKAIADSEALFNSCSCNAFPRDSFSISSRKSKTILEFVDEASPFGEVLEEKESPRSELKGELKSQEYDNVFGNTLRIDPAIFSEFYWWTKMKVERRLLNQTLLKDARKAFDILDHERSGSIDMRDLRVALRALGWESGKEEGRRIIHDIELQNRGPSLKQRIVEGTFLTQRQFIL